MRKIFIVSLLLLTLPGDKHNNATSSPPIAPAIKNDFPEVKQFTRVIGTGFMGAKQHLLRYKEKSFYENNAVFVDSTFFDVFTYHFTNGNSNKCIEGTLFIRVIKTSCRQTFRQRRSAWTK